MLSSEALGQLNELAQEVSQREGCFLYHLEFVGHGGQRILRIFIDTDEGHVSVDQCANVSRGMSLLLDVEDLIPGDQYDLEVSSPGLERPLNEVWHFEKAKGKTVLLKTNAPIPKPKGASEQLGPRKQVKGLLQEADGENLTIHSEDGIHWQVPMSIVHKARIVFVEDSPFKGKKGAGKSGKKGKSKKR